MRILAVELVVIGHGIAFFQIAPILQPPSIPYLQNMGVVILFIVSGFLILYTTLNKMEKRPGYSFREFFIDRFSRIYIGLFAALAFIVIIDLIAMRVSPSSYNYYGAFNITTFAGNLLQLQDYPIPASVVTDFGLSGTILNVTSFGSGRPLWTLAVEWWIYMSFGWLLLKKRIKIGSWAYYPILLFFSIVPLYNLLGGRGRGLTLTWLMGVFALFLIKRQLKVPKRILPIAALSSCLLGVLSVQFIGFTPYNFAFPFFIALALLFAVLWLDGLKSEVKPLLRRMLRFGAGYSFTLFLIHYSIYSLIVIFMNDGVSPWLLFLTSFLIANVMAALIAHFGETRYKTFSSFLKRHLLHPRSDAR
ncbi:MAG: acyltransferase [Methanomassiliicoccales archaeon]|nr:acyltransferase [Methanomassiliicoccales archaeon]